MRLQAIKLAGFKSFVDPTTVPFPSNLCAVVGPNGCGKSNIIDAVRWVMGESSAKTLRGESMADGIFNGSNSRKPVGQASIELLFDNAEGSLTGEYAAYSELSIKRQVTRDGQSNYFLNSQKCRRKDITDIFLGTGLGPRSYSIIEQGMIGSLVEAKPEELRVYIEEAAGISKYKERRKETERRISHTKDNLDRLSDIREELERQVHHLERQAKAAERYRDFKKEEREVQSQLQGLKWQAISRDARTKEDNINRMQIAQEAKIADQRRIDAEVEQKRSVLVELNDQTNEVQKRFYDHGTEIARIEDSIQFQNERNQQLNQDLEEASSNWFKIRADIDADQRKLGELKRELSQTEPQQNHLRETEEASVQILLKSEKDMHDWQEEWDVFNQSAAQSENHGHVQQSRIESLEQSIERLNNRMTVSRGDVERLQGVTIEAEIPPLQMMLGNQEEQIERIEGEIRDLVDHIETQREDNQRLSSQLDHKRSELQGVLGRFASLEALQQAALGQQDDAEMEWLERHNLNGNTRLGERIKVEDEWTVAVETVLGDYVQAVCVDGLDPVSELLGDFKKGSLNFLTNTEGKAEARIESRAEGTLLSKVTSDLNLNDLLKGVFVAQDLNAALQLRERLLQGQSVITTDGIWLGVNWLRVSKDQDANAGVIKRQAELELLGSQIKLHEAEASELTSKLDAGVASLQVAEADREKQATRLAEQQSAHSETRAQLGAKELQAEQVKTDLQRANDEIRESARHLEDDQTQLKVHRNQLQDAMNQMEKDTLQREQRQADRQDKLQALEMARGKARQDRDISHQLALKIQTLSSQISATEHAVSRLTEQQLILKERRQALEASISESEQPQLDLKTELKQHLEKRLAVENEMVAVRQKSEAVEHDIRALEQQRSKIEKEVEQIRSSLNQVKMDWQALEVRRTTIKEQLEADGQELEAVIESLSEDANEEDWEDKLRRVGNRIQRLGAINLAAIDEFKVQSERKQYLDAQNDDLEMALTTLENAIRKIDTETRTKFKETFDSVNSKLQQLFPKVFGGGHAYLEMTGADLLDTGVGLMARPPGKRNSSIHLLSGGEKVLTAIALVFAIFSLNPAPFCLLDEVDAPLDDANVERYSNLVKEMSRTVQFIYITHNKIAMEMAEQLMGVTMQEPGVSRLVSVEVDEAVAMAAV
ncbi:MAG: chromosome segregation protein SMC [Gammaproteobacteria bacterium]|nr:chromosome segregation protein SMC [Gammaproteobacteria bacterium]